jgi:23S rRNA (cytidine1920-2'-O)/16S rRNA (cytidine1409-2'-O)-methyltransferase
VFVNGRQILKAGSPIPEDATILVNAEVPKFVCRAGLKLEKALKVFDLTVTGKRALDSGLSTGGFTDCLLKAGAASVVGVDVGYGQVAQAIRIDPRVRVMERTNLRRLRRSDLPFEDGGLVDIVTLDLSFISLLKVLEAVDNVLSPVGDIIALVKPQFEAGKANVAAGGVVKDPEVREATVQAVIEGFRAAGFVCLGTVESPIRGATAGNIEYLCHFKRRKAEQGDV